jgi:hypothetical protein
MHMVTQLCLYKSCCGLRSANLCPPSLRAARMVVLTLFKRIFERGDYQYIACSDYRNLASSIEGRYVQAEIVAHKDIAAFS